MTKFLENLVLEQTQELRKKNEELMLSEERYHKMVDEVEDYAIIMLDPNGVILNWNKGAEKIKGYSESEIVGKNFNNFYLSKDRESGLPEKLLKEARDKGKAIHEGWRLRKDRTAFWGSIVLTSIHNDKDEIIGFSKVTRDLTERKMAEDKLKESNQLLEFQNRELEQFAYAASHDMKEPLRKIHFYNSAIFDKSAERLDDRSKEYLIRSINAVKKMTSLIDNLLNYSKATGSFLDFEKIELSKVVEDVILSFKEENEAEHMSFVIADLPVINGIPFQIKQLFSNLISNSFKYRHPARKAEVLIYFSEVNGMDINSPDLDILRSYYKVTVKDNGIGFDQRYADKIFNIFQRLKTNSNVIGSGIGLAICKKIMQNHKGLIRASGKEMEGATFEMYFPV
jgi:PAS domain S-box-containing protein